MAQQGQASLREHVHFTKSICRQGAGECASPALSLAVGTKPACSPASPSTLHSHMPQAFRPLPGAKNELTEPCGLQVLREAQKGAEPDPSRKVDPKTQSPSDLRAAVDRKLVLSYRGLPPCRWARVSCRNQSGRDVRGGSQSVAGTSTDVSRARMLDQVHKVTRMQSPGCLAMGKTKKTMISPQGDLSSPSISLVIWLRTPDLSYCWL